RADDRRYRHHRAPLIAWRRNATGPGGPGRAQRLGITGSPPAAHVPRGPFRPPRAQRPGNAGVRTLALIRKELASYFAGPLVYPAIVYAIQPFDPTPFFARYLGAFLFLASCIACGLFVSSLTESQVVASSCTFVLLLLFWIITWNEAAVSSSYLIALSQLSTFDHFFSFARGVIDLKDLTYFALFIGLFLFLTLRSMES